MSAVDLRSRFHEALLQVDREKATVAIGGHLLPNSSQRSANDQQKRSTSTKRRKEHDDAAEQTAEVASFLQGANSLLATLNDIGRFLHDNEHAFLSQSQLVYRGEEPLSESHKDQLERQTSQNLDRCHQNLKVLSGLLAQQVALRRLRTTAQKEDTDQLFTAWQRYDPWNDVDSFEEIEQQQLFQQGVLQVLQHMFNNTSERYLELRNARIRVQLSRTQAQTLSVPRGAVLAKHLSPLHSDYLFGEDDDPSEDDEELMCLSAEDTQQLAQENDDLFRDLQTKVDRTRQVEQQVQELARLHQMLATSVAEQAESIEEIECLATDAHLSVRTGNTHLEEASDTGISMRIYMLILILILSLALLFVNWIS